MKRIHKRAVQALNYTREAMKKYYDQKALQQPDYKEGDLVMLNWKNICTKRPSKKLSPKLYGPFKIVEAKGQHTFKLEISPIWKIHRTFHVSLLEPNRTSVRQGREQPPREPEEIDGDLEWEVAQIVKSEIISYTRKVCGRNKRMSELRYFVKWKGCSKEENTLEPPESLDNCHKSWLSKEGFTWLIVICHEVCLCFTVCSQLTHRSHMTRTCVSSLCYDWLIFL